jgi:PPOX class probable F420-dependent enzyme
MIVRPPRERGGDAVRRGLNVDDLGDLLELPILAVLAMHRHDGTILLSPVWHEWRDGGFNFWVSPDAPGKVRLLERDPRVSAVVAEDADPNRALEVRGTARVTFGPGFREVVRRTARRYVGPDGADGFAESMPEEGWVIRLVPQSMRAWDYAD